MLIKQYDNAYNKNNLTPFAVIAKRKEKPYCTHSMSARISTRYGNISFK